MKQTAPQLPAHVREKCPANSFHNEYARHDEPVWVRYEPIQFTGPHATHRLADLAATLINGPSRLPAKIHSPGRK